MESNDALKDESCNKFCTLSQLLSLFLLIESLLLLLSLLIILDESCSSGGDEGGGCNGNGGGCGNFNDVDDANPESCSCVERLTLEGVREGLLGNRSVFNDENWGFVGVLCSMLVEWVVVC